MSGCERGRFLDGGAWSSYWSSGTNETQESQLPSYPRTRIIAGKPFVAWDAADPRVTCLLAANIRRGSRLNKAK